MNADVVDVGDESNSTKRRRTHRVQNKPVRNSHNWETLPFPATIEVFSYLYDVDRVAMSQVCRNWNSCFKNPSLWRYRRFMFGVKLGKINYEKKDILFTSLFGRCLQHVEIQIWHGFHKNIKSIAKSVKIVTGNLKNAKLHQFVLTFISVNRFKEFSKLLDAVNTYFIEIFQAQTELKKVTLANCHFSQAIGTELLNALATSTGSELVYLDITNYIDVILNVDDAETLRQTLPKFSNLTSVSVHYSYISDEVLRHWAVSLRHKLETMRIIVSSREPHNHIIKRETWRELSSSCPSLKVTMVILNLLQSYEIISKLQPSIPLLTFIMISRYDDVQNSPLTATLKHLANCFHHHLEHLIIECDEMQDSVDEGLIDVLEQCRKLKTFRFVGKFSILVPNKICDLLSDGQSALHTCELEMTYYDPNVDRDVVNKTNLIRPLLPGVYDNVDPWDDDIYGTWD